METGKWQFLQGIITLSDVCLGAWLCDRVGTRNVMMLGFTAPIIFGLVIGVAFDRIMHILPLFVVFYGFMASSGNFSPGNTLGLLLTEN